MLRHARGSALLVIAVMVIVFGCQSGKSFHADAGTGAAAVANVQQEINALLDQYTQALLKKDLAAVDKIWADDLTFINLRGEMLSKQNRMDNLKTGATAFKSIQLSDRRIRTYDDAVVATFIVSLDAQYSGQEGSGDYRATTVWAKPKGMWQMVAVQMTRLVK